MKYLRNERGIWPIYIAGVLFLACIVGGGIQAGITEEKTMARLSRPDKVSPAIVEESTGTLKGHRENCWWDPSKSCWVSDPLPLAKR